MRVLLLGGTGFIGEAVNHRLRDAGHDTVTISRSAGADVRIDVTDSAALGRHLADNPYDVVVNLLGAGLSLGTTDLNSMTAVNADLPPALLTILDGLGETPHLIHTASSTERLPGHTLDESEYSRTKHEGTRAVRALAARSTVPVTILTVHNTYGPGQPNRRFVAHLIDQLGRGNEVSLNYPDRVRDFVYIADVAACVERAITLGPTGPAEVEVGSGEGISLMTAARIVADALGQPAALVTAAATPPPDPNPDTVASTLHGTYGLCTTGFAEGVRRTIEEV
jgi:nucleoside-diphosphate-sugar epimerase